MARFQHKRVSKRLLVAALGVATVSYVGCAADTGGTEEDYGADSLAEDTAAATPSADITSETGEKAARTNVALDQGSVGIRITDKFPPTGNLLPPPTGNLMAPPPPPTGNLMAPPPPPTGNLMAPPPKTVFEQAAQLDPNITLERGIRIPIPTGNLMAPPVREEAVVLEDIALERKQ
jgi:hypothetical protein